MNQPTPASRSDRRAAVLLLFTLVVAGSYFRHIVEYDNTNSRFFLLAAVVDDHALVIDRYHRGTVDKSFHEGHHYSNKAIGAPLIAAPLYFALRQFPPTRGADGINQLHRYVVNVAASVLCFAVLGLVLWRWGTGLAGDPVRALWMVMAFAFGSIAWVHATMFSGHLMAGALSFLAFAGLAYLRQGATAAAAGGAGRSGFAFAMGLLAGLGALCDYMAMFTAAILTVYALWSPLTNCQRAAFVIGGGLCILPLLAYNAACFGHPLAMSYGHQATPEFAEGSATGFLGVGLPDPVVLGKLLLSPARGVLFMMPVFLFSVAGWLSLRRRRPAEAAVIAVVVVGYFAINAGFYGWHAGSTHGPRYLVPMLPFLALPMALAPLRSGWFLVVFAASLVQVVPAIVSFPHSPSGIRNPLVDMIVPLARHGYLADSWLSVLGVSKIVGALIGLAGIGVLAGCTARVVARLPGKEPSGSGHAVASGLRAIVVVTLVGIGLGLVLVRTRPDHQQRYAAYYAQAGGVYLPR